MLDVKESTLLLVKSKSRTDPGGVVQPYMGWVDNKGVDISWDVRNVSSLVTDRYHLLYQAPAKDLSDLPVNNSSGFILLLKSYEECLFEIAEKLYGTSKHLDKVLFSLTSLWRTWKSLFLALKLPHQKFEYGWIDKQIQTAGLNLIS